MGVRLTDGENVALYDSTTGWSFGPVFNGEEEAEHFLRWFRESGPMWAKGDPRKLDPIELQNFIGLWHKENHDPETGEWNGDD